MSSIVWDRSAKRKGKFRYNSFEWTDHRNNSKLYTVHDTKRI